MGFLNWLVSGIGAVIGAVVDTAVMVVKEIRDSYLAYRQQGGATETAANIEAQKKRERLREVNDEIIHLRNRHMQRGSMSDQERSRWNTLREERGELLGKVNKIQEVKVAEKILETEASFEKVHVDVETTHVLQYNAFSDILGKKCAKCARPMKLQWSRNLGVANPKDFYWGCTGWYVPMQDTNKKACNNIEKLQASDYSLMTDMSAPEFSVTSDEFGTILAAPDTQELVGGRLEDLRSDLDKQQRGVALSTCPVHGEHMVLRKKKVATGLLDSHFLACPRWLPNDQGCTFIDKLKSGSQLAALLKSETGRGIL
jgi:hypothetical protein